MPWRRRHSPSSTQDGAVLLPIASPVAQVSPSGPPSINRRKRWYWRYVYGSTPQTISISSTTEIKSAPNRRIRNVRDALTKALDEIELLRKELEELRNQVGKPKRPEDPHLQFRSIAAQVEAWAERMLRPDDAEDENHDDGEGTIPWRDIKCQKMLRGRYNPDSRTQTSLVWLPDSRENSTTTSSKDATPWPCLRIQSILDAPLQDVTAYLSNEQHAPDYNSLLSNYRDVARIGPQTKLCWAQTPQVLFIQPRTFLTLCAYRWREDGTVWIVSQAVDEYSSNDDEDPLVATAFAFRGATVLAPDADDCNKTRISILVHASPGKDVPNWACRTATNTLAALEPFSLCYHINQGVQRVAAERIAMEEKARTIEETKETREVLSGVSTENDHETPTTSSSSWNNLAETQRPVGIAQLGYACFWPDGAEQEETPSEQIDGSVDDL